MRYIACTLVFLQLIATAAVVQGQSGLGSRKVTPPPTNWAILVGINYTSRKQELQLGDDIQSQQALEPLVNAANDAKGIAKTLTQFYEYEKDHVIVLTDDPGTPDDQLPTKKNIDNAIKRVREGTANVDDDSVMFFFAGHGIRFGSPTLSGNNVAMLALDVDLNQGKPVGNFYRLPFGLVEELGDLQADRKLVVLDCCHSGEIFLQHQGESSFQAKSHVASRTSNPKLLKEPAFQAMASCRALELASDGDSGNSKFTSALLHGLRRVPAQSNKQPVTVHQLLTHIQGFFDSTQGPDLRSLKKVEGEFSFFPRQSADFSQFLVEEKEAAYLRSMVISRQGSWWFKETPWFIPSIRAEIVQVYDTQHVRSRGSTLADLLDPEKLQRAAEDVLQRHEPNEGEVAKLRVKHARLLFDADSREKQTEAWEAIESDLMALLPKTLAEPMRGGQKVGVVKPTDETLQAVDVHLLAVVKHALGRDDALATYSKALKRYETEKSPPTVATEEEDVTEVANYSLQILHALCRVDHAELLQELKEYKQATDEYKSARDEIRQLNFKGTQRGYAAFFQTYNLCREADAWLAVNRWGQANDRLQQAIAVASDKEGSESPVEDHFLQAHAYRRDAWAKMMQWEIEQAICQFRKSNRILMRRFESEYKVNKPNEEVGEPSRSEDRPELDCVTSSTADQSSPAFKESHDYASKVAYLHNLHGIAMATRFEGDTAKAAEEYRDLVDQVEVAFTQFRENSADADIEAQFIGRTINTQERLGDCNLFGNPDFRDLSEACDDYRRAMSRIHLMRGEKRERSKAALLYKQALALSLPSPNADHELANQMCTVADRVYAQQEDKANGLFQALGTLTTLTVRACQVSDAMQTNGNQGTQDALREGIIAYRDEVGQHPHRDQLEMLLFASNVLVKHAGARSKYQTLEDADLLLSFCRMALEPHEGTGTRSSANSLADSRKYLRPYFDTAMAAKMQLGDSHVKEMLQIQAEATQGTFDVKGAKSQPVLAIYALNNKAYLLVDIPKGLSRCIPLAESYYTVDKVQKACIEDPLPLPKEVRGALVGWLEANPGETWLKTKGLRWKDPVRDFPDTVSLANNDVVQQGSTTVQKPIQTDFPFEIPEVGGD